MPSQNTYDLVPYTTNPRRTTHPETASTIARLAGLNPAPPNRCRILEIGCGTGGNLIPMADILSESTLLGIDPSQVQIDEARKAAKQFQLGNIRFEPIGIEELSPDLEPFDYIICHGVFSWVPFEIQELLFKACAARLAPHGVAMISYNVLPGWHYRMVARDAIRFIARDDASAADNVRSARSFLQFLSQAVIDAESTHGKNLKAEIGILENSYDYYIFHEHLEQHNAPCYFRDFAGRAAGHGLQYLGDAGLHPMLSGMRVETRKVLEQLNLPLIELEQHIDFIRSRSFRHTLLVRGDAPVDRGRKAKAVESLRIRAACIADPSTWNLGLGDIQNYRSLDDVEMSTSAPLMNGILRELISNFPRSLPFDVCREHVLKSIAKAHPENLAEADERFTEIMLSLQEAGFIRFHSWDPPIVATVSERPRVWRIAAEAARNNSIVPCMLHSLVKLDPLDRYLVVQCDGTRTVPEIVQRLESAKIEGDEEIAKAEKGPIVEERLKRFADHCLLVG